MTPEEYFDIFPNIYPKQLHHFGSELLEQEESFILSNFITTRKRREEDDVFILGNIFSLSGHLYHPENSQIIGLTNDTSYLQSSEGAYENGGYVNSEILFLLDQSKSLLSFSNKLREKKESEEIALVFEKTFQVIRQSLRFLLWKNSQQKTREMLNTILKECQTNMVMIGTGFHSVGVHSHAIAVVIVEAKDLYFINGGEGIDESYVVEHWEINNKEGLTVQLLDKLINQRYTKEALEYFQKELHDQLKLTFVQGIKSDVQLAGTCETYSKWYSVLALLFHQLRDRETRTSSLLAQEYFLKWKNEFEVYKLNEYLKNYPSSPLTPILCSRILMVHHDYTQEQHLQIGKIISQYINAGFISDDFIILLCLKHWDILLIEGKETAEQLEKFLAAINADFLKGDKIPTLKIRIFLAVIQKDLKTAWDLIESSEPEKNKSNKSEILSLLSCQGFTLLHIAMRNDDLPMIQFLCRYKELINQRSYLGSLSLGYGMSLQAVQLLHQQGALLEEEAKESREISETPFNAFLDQGKIALVEYLLKQGIQPNQTSLAILCVRGNVQMGRLLYRYNSVFFQTINAQQQTALHLACDVSPDVSSHENVDFVKFLIQIGLDPNLEDANGETPIFLAMKNNNTAVVEFLLMLPIGIKYRNKKNIDLEYYCDREKNTPLKEKIEARIIEIYKLEIYCGEEIKKRNEALERAFKLEELKKAKKAKEDQKSSLPFARGKNGKRVVRFDGDYFVFNPKPPVLFSSKTYFISPTIEEHFISAIRENNIRFAKACLLKNKFNFNNRYKNISFLHEAYEASKEMFDLLLSIPGININITNRDGQTLLHRTIIKGDQVTMEYFLDHPAIDLNPLMQSESDLKSFPLFLVLKERIARGYDTKVFIPKQIIKI